MVVQREPSIPAIELRSVCKSYGGKTVVRDVSVSIAPGEFVAVVGASGSGKTTTLKTINRLIDADIGQILIRGQNVRELDAHRLRRSVGYVFQGVGLFPHMTVGQNIRVTP